MRYVIVFTCVLLAFSCKDEGMPPPSYTSTVQLTLEEASVTEVWLKVRFTDPGPPRAFALRRGVTLVLSGSFAGQDTVVSDTTASPNHSYNYTALRLSGSSPIDSSSSLQVTTLDTTNHEGYMWSVDTLGIGNSSALFDVAIINDTLVYAVGRVSLNDSSGQLDPILYNMARWNGGQWELKRIQFYIICGGTGTTPYPTRSIIAFSQRES